MNRLVGMDEGPFVARVQAEARRVLEGVADAVNGAPAGNVISGSEGRVRDLMAELRRVAFEAAVQMRVDPTESSFAPRRGRTASPSGRQVQADGKSKRTASPSGRQGQAEQGQVRPEHGERERAGRPHPDALACPG